MNRRRTRPTRIERQRRYDTVTQEYVWVEVEVPDYSSSYDTGSSDCGTSDSGSSYDSGSSSYDSGSSSCDSGGSW